MSVLALYLFGVALVSACGCVNTYTHPSEPSRDASRDRHLSGKRRVQARRTSS